MKTSRFSNVGKGFTLMETLLAIALVGVLVSMFITVFLPARAAVLNALSKQDAERITSILRTEMSTLKPNEIAPAGATRSSVGQYVSSFDKAFMWLQRSNRPSRAIVIFSYRADTSKAPRPDGTYPALPLGKSAPNYNSQLISIACPMDDPLHKDDIRDAIGSVFIVRMTQLIPDPMTGGFRVAGSPGIIQEASDPSAYVSNEKDREAWGGAVFYRADFYLMRPANPARYRNRTWKQLGEPCFSANLSFRR